MQKLNAQSQYSIMVIMRCAARRDGIPKLDFESKQLECDFFHITSSTMHAPCTHLFIVLNSLRCRVVFINLWVASSFFFHLPIRYSIHYCLCSPSAFNTQTQCTSWSKTMQFYMKLFLFLAFLPIRSHRNSSYMYMVILTHFWHSGKVAKRNWLRVDDENFGALAQCNQIENRCKSSNNFTRLTSPHLTPPLPCNRINNNGMRHDRLIKKSDSAPTVYGGVKICAFRQ